MTCKCPSYNPVPWSELFPLVQMSALSAPINVIEYQLRQAAIEFATRTGVIEFDFYIDLQAGVQDYQIEPPDGYRVNAVRQVCAPCGELVGVTKMTCDGVRSGEYRFVSPDKLVIGFDPCEDMPDSLLVRASVFPTQESCGIDADTYQRFSEVLSEGALSRILIMPNASWYNTQAAGIMLRRFKLGIDRAKNSKGREFSGPKFMKAPRFV